MSGVVVDRFKLLCIWRQAWLVLKKYIKLCYFSIINIESCKCMTLTKLRFVFVDNKVMSISNGCLINYFILRHDRSLFQNIVSRSWIDSMVACNDIVCLSVHESLDQGVLNQCWYVMYYQLLMYTCMWNCAVVLFILTCERAGENCLLVITRFGNTSFRHAIWYWTFHKILE